MRADRFFTKRFAEPPRTRPPDPSPARLRVARVLARLETVGTGELDRVVAYYGEEAEDILSTRRAARFVKARRALWSLVRSVRWMSFAELGEMFEVDATTVRAGVYLHNRRARS